jgi:hypothetical protein
VKAAISKQGKPCDELIVGGVHGWNGVRRD